MSYRSDHRSTPHRIATTVSITNLLSNGTGQMRATVPTTKSILKILLPTIFPIAIPAFPLRAAETDVTSSGRDVPNATIVSPIKRSLHAAGSCYGRGTVYDKLASNYDAHTAQHNKEQTFPYRI